MLHSYLFNLASTIPNLLSTSLSLLSNHLHTGSPEAFQQPDFNDFHMDDIQPQPVEAPHVVFQAPPVEAPPMVQPQPVEAPHVIFQAPPVEAPPMVFQPQPVEAPPVVFQAPPVEAPPMVFQPQPVEAPHVIFQAPAVQPNPAIPVLTQAFAMFAAAIVRHGIDTVNDGIKTFHN